MAVELTELFLIQLPTLALLAGLYYKQGKQDQKLEMIYKNIEFKTSFKN